MWLAFIFVFIIGILNRIVDMATSDGLKLNRYLGCFLGALYGFLIAYIMGNYHVLTTLSLMIVVSVLVTGKIDHPFHYTGIASMLFFLIIYGIGPLEPVLGIIFMAGAIMDEKGNDLADRRGLKGIPGIFFHYRLTMEVITFLVSLITGIWTFFIAMAIYDLGFSCIFTDKIRRRLISMAD